MNKHGQSLVTFILFLPILAMFLAYFINSMESMMMKNKIDGIIYDNLKVAIDKDIRDEEKIVSAIKENYQDLEITLILNGDDINITASGKRKNIFGNIFNMDKYDMSFNYCANYVDKKIEKNCG